MSYINQFICLMRNKTQTVKCHLTYKHVRNKIILHLQFKNYVLWQWDFQRDTMLSKIFEQATYIPIPWCAWTLECHFQSPLVLSRVTKMWKQESEMICTSSYHSKKTCKFFLNNLMKDVGGVMDIRFEKLKFKVENVCYSSKTVDKKSRSTCLSSYHSKKTCKVLKQSYDKCNRSCWHKLWKWIFQVKKGCNSFKNGLIKNPEVHHHL